jgi:hypothetical protein
MKFLHMLPILSIPLSACASTSGVLSMPPTQVFRSDHSKNEVAFCLANKNNTAALDQDDGSKVILIKRGATGAVSLAFKVFSDGTGSRTEYRKAFGSVGGSWKHCVGLEPWRD